VSIPLPRTVLPRPKTVEAVLFCEKDKKFTKHAFTTAIEVKGANDHRTQTKFMYSCGTCNNQRVWGSED